MAGPIDIAYVEILPDLKKFDQEASKEISKALEGALREAEKAAASIEDSLQDAFQSAGQAAERELDGIQRQIKEVDGTIVVKVIVDGQEIDRIFKRDIQGRFRDERGKLASTGELIGLGITDGIRDGLKKGSGGLFSQFKGLSAGSLISGIGDTIRGGISSAFVGLVSTAGAAISVAGSAIGGILIAAMAPVVIGGITSVLTTAGALIGGAGIIGIGAFALKENERLIEETKNAVDEIKSIFASAAEPLIEPFSDAISEVRKLVNSLKPELQAIFSGIIPSIRALTSSLDSTLRPILDGIKQALPGINAAFAGLARSLPLIGQAIGDFLTDIFKDTTIIEKITKDFGVFIAWLVSIAAPAIRFFNVIFAAFVNLLELGSKGIVITWRRIQEAFDGGTGALDRISQAWAPLKTAVMAVWDALKQFAAADTDEQLATSLTTLVEKIKEAWKPLKEFIGVIWDEIWAFVKRIWEEKVVPWWNGTVKPFLENEIKGFFVRIFRSMVDDAISAITGLPGRAASALANLGSSIQEAVIRAVAGAAKWLFNAGSSIVQGLIDGIRSRIDGVRSAAERLGQIIRDSKGPESADKVMLRPAGQFIVDGLISGIGDRENSLRRSLTQISNLIGQPIPGALDDTSMPLSGRRGVGNVTSNVSEESMLAVGGQVGVRRWSGGQSAVEVNITVDSGGTKMDELLVQLLRKAIRVQGGNVQKVLGQGVGV